MGLACRVERMGAVHPLLVDVSRETRGLAGIYISDNHEHLSFIVLRVRSWCTLMENEQLFVFSLTCFVATSAVVCMQRGIA